ncbi:MAG: hypothetical protein FJ295_07795 [Planctomycetes bacterium]|nr:hypothetical protein [Planctomycetota bacterium]
MTTITFHRTTDDRHPITAATRPSTCSMLVFCAIAVGAAAFSFAPIGRAAEPDNGAAPAGQFECRYAISPPVIDGKPDDEIWMAAEEISSFSLPWLGEKRRQARTATRARLLWDNQYLYFLADMEDRDLYADVTEHDGVTWENDVFELFFKPSDEHPGYYEFQVNAANTAFDMFVPQRGSGNVRRYARADEFHLESKVALRGTLNNWRDQDTGWTVEGRIPWRDFVRSGGPPRPDERWKFVLCRYDYSVEFDGPELSWCSPLSSAPHADFHRFEDYATLRFVPPPRRNAARGIPERIPWTTSRVVGSPDPPPPYRTRPAFDQPPLPFPIAATLIPGRAEWLIITQPAPFAPSQLVKMRDAADVRSAEVLLEIPDTTAYSITFHPNYRHTGWVYLGYNGTGSDGFRGKTTKIVRYHLHPGTGTFDPSTARVILEWESDGHNGGATAFGNDGMLYVTTGDGTSDSDTNLAGQDLSHLLGKVLRIDVDHPTATHAYSIPADNPFAGKDGIRAETWCYGLRNPWRIAVDPRRGALWVGNNGQDLWEQAYRIEKGANYGWSVMEGSHPFYPDRKAGPTPFVAPTVEHPHSEARSLTGGLVYYGRKYPELQGAYIYGDHSTGKVWGVQHDGSQIVWHRELTDTPFHITGFALDRDGELLILEHAAAGNLHYLEPNPPQADDASPFPHRLSETGIFRSLPEHKFQEGMIPYSVNAALWSDGAHKERAFGIPHHPDRLDSEMTIDFSQPKGWGFPDDTVLVKSFALERTPGDPGTRFWIETRLLVKQQGEWIGYSYLWNDAQTDAELVAAEGADRQFELQVPRSRDNPSGQLRQHWRYPSRTECMVCHSRAANYVLGLSTAQMNRDHDYDGRRDNQLRVLEHLGLLRVNWHGDTLAALREELTRQGKSEAEIGATIAERTGTRLQRPSSTTSLLTHAPDQYPRLADPYDRAESLERRARAYLHANCSQCHLPAGGGNAQLDLDYATSLDQSKLLTAPLHHRFDVQDARIVAPGSPEKSVLLKRVGQRGKGQMPQLATDLVDRPAVELLEEWIRGLPRP